MTGVFRSLRTACHRFIGGKYDLSNGRARRSRQALRQHFDLLSLFVEPRNQEVIKLVRLDAEDRFFLRDQPFIHHLQRDAHRGQAGALAVARLQHVELAVLDGELEILHVFVMLFQPRGDVAQLAVNLGHDLFEFEDRNRSAHARDDVLALRIQQEFAVELFRAGRGIAREADARAGGVAQVAVDHRLHVDRGAEHVVGNIVDAAIVLGAVVLPGAEHGVARHDQLLVRILREVALGVLFDDLLVFLDDFLQRLGVEFGVELYLPLLLLAVEDFFELGLFDLEHDVAEHLNQPAVGVIGKARIVLRLASASTLWSFRPRFRIVSIMPGMENFAPERTLTSSGLSPLPSFWPWRFSSWASAASICASTSRETALLPHVFAASLGLNGEAGRDGQARIGHFGEASAFAAEHIFHFAVAVGLAAAEGVDDIWSWSYSCFP